MKEMEKRKVRESKSRTGKGKRRKNGREDEDRRHKKKIKRGEKVCPRLILHIVLFSCQGVEESLQY